MFILLWGPFRRTNTTPTEDLLWILKRHLPAACLNAFSSEAIWPWEHLTGDNVRTDNITRQLKWPRFLKFPRHLREKFMIFHKGPCCPQAVTVTVSTSRERRRLWPWADLRVSLYPLSSSNGFINTLLILVFQNLLLKMQKIVRVGGDSHRLMMRS